ncbi:DUF2509 family protein [Erwinia tasmaniensis]|uniref:Exported protein n=1 Tax=Erwinia tasmaniensis (strain DSM 17950 / CFBP 7177 / CIP 109463 / NCPPB 4357 / Et1/99) TaxID=465817 RepID=B2VFU3_ERWT9|nr:DUF2509 family protein [Erwinia tasmaniensis]CAO97801.1 Putative exported protein [Erwinia tasmaniensis Et1/99]
MRPASQRGGSTLLMVIILLLMGTLMLNATRRQLGDAINLVGDERIYLQQYTAATSALAWGQRLPWKAGEGWRCQQLGEYRWRACLHVARMLLRADSGPDTLTLYHWMNKSRSDRWKFRPHGWLDYCPLTEKGGCDVD